MHSFGSINEKIQFCFDDPKQPLDSHKRNGTVSVLFLLRQELISTAGFDPLTTSESEVAKVGAQARLFATMSLCFTAMDLLAKFSRGDGEGVGARFKSFLKDPAFGQQHSDLADLFYAARNSIVHAFGAPDVDALGKLGFKHVGFVHTPRKEISGFSGFDLVNQHGDTALLNVNGILSKTIHLIDKVNWSLHGADSGPARSVFEPMFDKYGTIEVP